MKELGIYIHIPFCKQKCFYCDFISYADKNEFIYKYIECLKKEIIETAKKVCKEKYEITTIYIGGGTPSYIDSKYIEEIIQTLIESYRINIKKVKEITIEVNPGTVNKEKLEKYKDIGINRLSIGLQTNNDQLLKNIGRIHTYQEFLQTYNYAKEVKFENINVDLMLGLPNQTIYDLQTSLRNIIKLNPNHISVYSLILEDDTKLKKLVDLKKMQLPNEEVERKMYWITKYILKKSGYIHYEISNFAKKGFESKHNVNCWKQKEYLGFGAAAHSYYESMRYSNIGDINKYISNIEKNKLVLNKSIHEIQTEKDKEKEYMLLGLRKINGINITEFKNKFLENPIYIFREQLNKLVNEKLIRIQSNQIKLTKKGIDFANLVWEEFI